MMDNLYRKALTLSYFTVGYNILEGVASVIAGAFAGSIALVGFGLDSFVESLSGIIMIWRFRKHGIVSLEEEEEIEHRALKLVGYTFFILTAYILYESVTKLYYVEIPDTSLVGIIIAVLSIIIMPILYIKKVQVGKTIGSKSLLSDAKETLACTFLSFALLSGLGLNYLWGLWQADPIVGIIVALYLVKEGREIVTGEED
ncbi:MAG: cation transporter [Spirochaetota bacterium]|nr:cation transporter [Spirochaetota bacterium]